MRVHSTGKQRDGHAPDVPLEQERRLVHCEGVKVHHAIQHAAAALLKPHPLPDGPQVVAKVDAPRWLDAREDPRYFCCRRCHFLCTADELVQGRYN